MYLQCIVFRGFRTHVVEQQEVESSMVAIGVDISFAQKFLHRYKFQ